MDLYRDKIIEFMKISKGKDIFCFDTETTGLLGKSERVDIIEFSCIKISFGEAGYTITDSLDLFINPGYPIPAEILQFNLANNTGITQEKIDLEGVTQKEAVKIIKDFWGETPILIGYNSKSFDEPLVIDLF